MGNTSNIRNGNGKVDYGGNICHFNILLLSIKEKTPYNKYF